MFWFIFAITGTFVLTSLAIKDVKKTVSNQNKQLAIDSYKRLLASNIYISKDYSTIKSLYKNYEKDIVRRHLEDVKSIKALTTPIIKVNNHFVIATITPIIRPKTHHTHYHMDVNIVKKDCACFKKYRPLFDIYYDMSDGYIPIKEIENDLSLIETENQNDVDAIKTLIAITPEHFLERKYRYHD